MSQATAGHLLVNVVNLLQLLLVVELLPNVCATPGKITQAIAFNTTVDSSTSSSKSSSGSGGGSRLLKWQQQAITPPVLLSNYKALTLVFPITSMLQAPVPSPAYPQVLMNRWKFTPGSLGFIVITRHNFGDSPAVTSELAFFPGQYQPRGCPPGKTFYSAQRWWTSQEAARVIGRSMWGFPKEKGDFNWGPQSVHVSAGGNLLFSASFAARSWPTSSVSSSGLAQPGWFEPIVEQGINTIQWPIKSTLNATLESNRVMPSEQMLTFDTSSETKILETASIILDPVAFTGSQDLIPMVDRSLGTALVGDVPWVFSDPPGKLQC